ncbi:MAG: hypothetical protein WCP17_01260 [bacterium]
MDFLNKFSMLRSRAVPVIVMLSFIDVTERFEIKTPVIVWSNLGQPEDEKRAKELGAVGFFVKTDIQMSEFIEKIKQIIK